MPMKIDKYQVVVSAKRQDVGGHVRAMVLTAPPSESGSIKDIRIYFLEQPPSTFGSLSGSTISVNPPLRDFDHMYHLLQTEKPVSAHWVADTNNNLTWFELYTGDEPLGEGPRDFG